MAVAELTTRRLILRPVVAEDARAFMALAKAADVAAMTAAIPHPLTAADGDVWFASCSRDNRRVFAILGAEDRAFLGAIGLTLGNDTASAELDLWLGRDHWGQGYGTEAVRRFIVLAFSQMKLGAVTAEVMAGNAAATRLLEKIGFRETGKAMRAWPARGAGAREVVLFTATRASFAQTALSQAVGRE